MVQAADLRDRYHRSCLDGLNRAGDGGVLLQRQVSPRMLVVVEVGSEDSAQARLVQHDHVIQTLPTNRADQPLDVGILPRGLRRGEDLLDSKPLYCLRKLLAVASVAVA